jgi:outer membrane protein assembly factor BamB
MHRRLIPLALLFALASGWPGGAVHAEDERAPAPWFQWRGPDRDGSVPGADWPDSLAGLSKIWRVELGKGYPGPVADGERVFVVESPDDDTAAVRALDLSTGREIWTRAWPSGGKVPFFAASNGDWVRSTPAYDGETLFVGDMKELLVALDGTTGEVRWQVDLPRRFGADVPDFGFASSPLVDGEFVYVQAANSLVKLNKNTGETVWRSLEHSGSMGAGGAFSSPVVAEIHGKRQLVVLTRHELSGVDLETGEVLWSIEVPNFRGMNILTPVVHENAVFTSPYKNQSRLYEVSESSDGLRVEEAWSNKASGYMSSPIVIDGHAYLHLGNRRVECIDLASGDSRWRSESFGKYWSMVYQGERVLALDEEGILYLFRATPDRFELLDTREISDDETWGHIAVVGDTVLVRELEGIVAYRWGPAPAP